MFRQFTSYPSVCHLLALTGWVREHLCNQMVLGLGSVPLLEHLSCKTDVSVSLACIGFNFTFPGFLTCMYRLCKGSLYFTSKEPDSILIF